MEPRVTCKPHLSYELVRARTILSVHLLICLEKNPFQKNNYFSLNFIFQKCKIINNECMGIKLTEKIQEDRLMKRMIKMLIIIVMILTIIIIIINHT